MTVNVVGILASSMFFQVSTVSNLVITVNSNCVNISFESIPPVVEVQSGGL